MKSCVKVLLFFTELRNVKWNPVHNAPKPSCCSMNTADQRLAVSVIIV